MIAELERALAESSGIVRFARAIIEVGLAYVRFGVERPDLYRALFSSQLAGPLEFREKLWEAGEISYSSRKAYESLAAVKQIAFKRCPRLSATRRKRGRSRRETSRISRSPSPLSCTDS